MQGSIDRRRFLKHTSVAGGAIALMGLVPSVARRAAASPAGAPAVVAFGDAAHTAYARLKDAFDESTNYWHLGNAWDTMLDYLALAWKDHPDQGIARSAFDKFKTTEGGPDGACWYDDYSWWGIASTKAFDPRYRAIFEGTGGGDSRLGNFQDAARRAWRIVRSGESDAIHLGAPNGWLNRDNMAGFDPRKANPDRHYFDRYRPRFPGGTWQYDIFHVARTMADGADKATGYVGPLECNGATRPTSDPRKAQPPTLGPYQLTVMNGLYLVQATRLALALGRSTDRDDKGLAYEARRAARDQQIFFQTWFDLPPAESLLLTFPGGATLVRERVATYGLQRDGSYPRVENWDPFTCWGGDQGLVMGGLADYVALNSGARDAATAAQRIASGVREQMAISVDYAIAPWYPTFPYDWEQTGDGTVRPTCAKSGVYNKLECWDRGDYASGSGVFMRYLLSACQQEQSPIAGLVGQPPYQAYLRSAADAASNALDLAGQDLFRLMNILATLTTAIQLLR